MTTSTTRRSPEDASPLLAIIDHPKLPAIARRSLLGGFVAAASLGAAPAAAIVAVGHPSAAAGGVAELVRASAPPVEDHLQVDPIFAAIEQHRLAFMEMMAAWRVKGGMVSSEFALEHDAEAFAVAAKEAEDTTTEVAHAAARALGNILPTTIAGVTALLAYVDHFNAGGVAPADMWPGDKPEDFCSAPYLWLAMEDQDTDIDMFGYMILTNARRALERIGGAA